MGKLLFFFSSLLVSLIFLQMAIISPIYGAAQCDANGEFCNLGTNSCPSGFSEDVNASWECVTGLGGSGTGTSYPCCAPNPTPPPGNTYDCGGGTPISSYCSVGPCNPGYAYQNAYSCDPTWDGCCTQCPSSETCFQGNQSTPYYVPNGQCGWKYCAPYCNSGGPTNCGACGGGSEPTNTCGSTTGGQTCYHDTNNSTSPAPSSACAMTGQSAYGVSCTQSYDNCSNNYYCPGGAGFQTDCHTHVTAHAFVDTNHDGNQDPGESDLQGVDMDDNGNHITTNNSGDSVYSGYTSGTQVFIQGDTSTPLHGWYFQDTSITHSVTLNNGNGNPTLNYAFVPMFSISGRVYTDWNHDGSGSGDPNYTASAVQIRAKDNRTGATITVNTAGNGTFIFFKDEINDSYTITLASTPANYLGTDTSQTVTVNGGDVGNIDLGITPLYQIQGNIFNDKNKNENYDPGAPANETLYTGSASIHITGVNGYSQTINTSSGTYATPNTLLSGSYTVSYASTLPTNYTFTTNSSWAVTVGDPAGSPDCKVSSSPDAVCGGQNNGSISNLNIGVSNEQTHYGSVCLDIRNDNNGGGTTQDLFPPPPATCGGQPSSQAIVNNGTCSTGSGIVFSCNGTFDFGLGDADANNWTAGGTASQDNECYSGGGLDVIPTSYDYLMTTAKESNITPTNLDNTVNANPATSCTVTDCTLPANLPKGIYQVQGDLTMHAGSYTFPAPADPSTVSQAYIILVKGDLHINGNILVPKGSVVVFSVAGSIYVDKSVGNVITDVNSTSVNTPNLEGVYSSDHSFYVESYGSTSAICNADGSPLDRRLVILGVMITNASKTGGSFVNNRDLCEYDTSCTSVQTGDGNGSDGLGDGGSGQGLILNGLLDLLADGKFLLNKNFSWQEIKP